MRVTKEEPVGSIVMRNLQAASVFNAYGIDFFSQGERSLEHACLDDNVPITNLMEDLWELPDQKPLPDFAAMDLTKLSTYILRTHHKFTERKVTFIRHTLDRVPENNRFRNIGQIRQMFLDLSIYLTVHMKHEEFIIFPSIQKLVRTKSISTKTVGLGNTIGAMKEDHRHEVITLKRLNILTHNYSVPHHSEYALKIAFDAMKELEDDLKIHMHLENNILFPRAMNLQYLLQQHLN